MSVITVSREYGSGGKAFGRTLAERLDWDFLDSALVDEVARRMRCSEDLVKRWDERGEGLILRLLRALQSAHPEASAPGPVAPEIYEAEPHPDRVMATVKEVILEEARRREAVIVGRGGAFVLAGMPQVLHVRLVGRDADRIARISDRFELSREDAEQKIQRIDRERCNYIKHHFGLDWRSPVHYSLVINTSDISIEEAAELTLRAVEKI